MGAPRQTMSASTDVGHVLATQLLPHDDSMRSANAASARTRWLIAGCMILLLSSNHWARDSLGALEVPLEDRNGPFGLSIVQYNALTTGYFVPNIVVPLLAGGFAQRFGAANAIVLFCLFAALGNGLVALSALRWSYPLLFIGRACMGLG
jgi:MFS family permease